MRLARARSASTPWIISTTACGTSSSPGSRRCVIGRPPPDHSQPEPGAGPPRPGVAARRARLAPRLHRGIACALGNGWPPSPRAPVAVLGRRLGGGERSPSVAVPLNYGTAASITANHSLLICPPPTPLLSEAR